MPESQPPLRQPPIRSLAMKIILFVFASTFASALVVGWFSIESTYASLHRSIDRHYPASLERAAERLGAHLAAGRAEIEALAAGARRTPSRGQVEQQLAGALARSQHFEGLAWVAPEGTLRGAVGEVTALAPTAKIDVPAAARIRALPGSGALAAVAPVSRAAGQPARGAMVGVFRGSALAALMAAEKPDPSASVLLVDDRGQVVTGAAPPGAVGRVPLEELVDGGAPGVREYTNARGVRVIGCARTLELSGWHVAAEAPFEAAFEPVLSATKRIFAIDLGILLLFGILAYRITVAAVKPIETLSNAARRIAQGQFDVEIPEPRRQDEIGLLAHAFNNMTRKLHDYQTQIEAANRDLTERNAELQRAKETFEQLSITDELTKLHNHRFFQDHLTREMKRVNRVHEPLAMLLLDIDDFKSLNDHLGHAAGDELLVGIARTMNEIVRDSDLLARYGGDEFAVLCSNTDLVGAYRLAEKIRIAISEASFILDDSLRPTGTTVSIGVARFVGDRRRFFQDADRALYRAKAQGKNCVIADEDGGLEGLSEPS